jgi:hypothetical protein
MAMNPTEAAAAELPGGNAGLARGMAAKEGNRRDAARMMGLEAGRLDAAERRAAARPAAPEPEDYASTSDIKRPETVRRPAPRRAPAPQRMSDSDRLNAMEMDRIMQENYSRPEPSSSEPMKKGGKAQAYKKGGSIVKMAGGGAVRGCGIASRGKTRGRMV